MERIVTIRSMPVDPLHPPKFKHKRIPKAYGLPPVTVMQSPPRPVTVEDQKEWKIPPCVSNWKNPKGYTIPLDKRLCSDFIQKLQINDHFAQLSEALHIAEQQAREAVYLRSKAQKEMMMKEKERKDQEIRALAQKARSKRTVTVGSGFCGTDTKQETKEWIQREKVREERHGERVRERRLLAVTMGKKRKIPRDQDRDISEKVALGMALPGSARAGEVMYDQRLFNQEKGTDSGFTIDDQYNVYDKGLFTTKPTLSTLYRSRNDAEDEKIRKTDRFKPVKGFTGAGENRGTRDGPVEFKREEAEDVDPFGLDQIMTQVKGGR